MRNVFRKMSPTFGVTIGPKLAELRPENGAISLLPAELLEGTRSCVVKGNRSSML